MIFRRWGIGVTIALVAGSAAQDAVADGTMPASATKVVAPGRNVASDDTAEAIALNPANVAHLPAYELRWSGAFCSATAFVGCGHAVSLGVPLPFGLATGFRLDYVQPPSRAVLPFGGADYTWLTWALAYKVNSEWAFGGSLSGSFSERAATNRLLAVDLAGSYRPIPQLGFAVVARAINAPRSGRVPPAGVEVLDRSAVLSMAYRPLGDRRVEVGLEGRYMAGANTVLPRATFGVDVPRVGRVRADVEMVDPFDNGQRGVAASAGLEIAFDRFTGGGGIMAGSGLGGKNFGGFATASISGYKTPGIPDPSHAVSIRIENTPGNRGHYALLRKLWKVAKDPHIKAVTLILRAEPATSYAHAEEVVDAMRLIRSKGKKVICSLEANEARSLYVCANADRTVMSPAGGLRYAGLKSQYMYFGAMLSKVGIRAEIFRIGAHKSAPEQFTNDRASDVARADHEEMLREIESEFVRDVAAGRHLTESQVRIASARGPFMASEAREAGFIDGYAYDDELEKVTREVVGSSVRYRAFEWDDVAPKSFEGHRPKVAVVYVDGDMIDGRSRTIPILGNRLVGSYTIEETLKALREDSSVKSVVLRLETPGGSSMAADVIWREVRLLSEKKPVIASMGSVAASAGYYIATGAPTIMASPLTVTGSIGIFYGKADVSALLHKVGVNVETYKTAPRADAESFYRPYTEDERVELKHKVEQFYDIFLDRVSIGRHMTKEAVNAVGQGKVWLGSQALQHRLIDKMGGFRQAIDAARQAAQLNEDAIVVEYPSAEPTFVEKALKIAGIGQSGEVIALPAQLRDAARAVAPFAIYDGDTPLARLEAVPVEPEPRD